MAWKCYFFVLILHYCFTSFSSYLVLCPKNIYHFTSLFPARKFTTLRWVTRRKKNSDTTTFLTTFVTLFYFVCVLLYFYIWLRQEFPPGLTVPVQFFLLASSLFSKKKYIFFIPFSCFPSLLELSCFPEMNQLLTWFRRVNLLSIFLSFPGWAKINEKKIKQPRKRKKWKVRNRITFCYWMDIYTLAHTTKTSINVHYGWQSK